MGRKNNLKKKIIYSVVCFTLFFQQIGFAQVVGELNIAGHLANMHSGISIDKFRPLHLRYFSYDLKSDNFKFLFDKGDFEKKGLSPKGTDPEEKFKEETQTLLKYFLIGITLPDSKFWVNLRPDSEDQIIEPELEQTDLGKVLLEADLQLKKDTAKYTSPETTEGREYWNKLYKKAEELFGYESITIPTLTRPWIVPGEIIIRETEESAFIYKSTLKVMLEEDYLNVTKSPSHQVTSETYSFKDPRLKELNAYSSQLIRELIIPKLTKEVNTSKRYAPLRQVFYSLILSRWFKARFKGLSPSELKGLSPQGTDPKVFSKEIVPFYVGLIDSQNLNGLLSKESWSKTTYFKEYQKSFNNGEYNLKEPVYTPTGQVIRSYFSGGFSFTSPGTEFLGLEGGLNSGVYEGNQRFVPVDLGHSGVSGQAGSPVINNEKGIARRDLLIGLGAGIGLAAGAAIGAEYLFRTQKVQPESRGTALAIGPVELYSGGRGIVAQYYRGSWKINPNDVVVFEIQSQGEYDVQIQVLPAEDEPGSEKWRVGARLNKGANEIRHRVSDLGFSTSVYAQQLVVHHDDHPFTYDNLQIKLRAVFLEPAETIHSTGQQEAQETFEEAEAKRDMDLAINVAERKVEILHNQLVRDVTISRKEYLIKASQAYEEAEKRLHAISQKSGLTPKFKATVVEEKKKAVRMKQATTERDLVLYELEEIQALHRKLVDREISIREYLTLAIRISEKAEKNLEAISQREGLEGWFIDYLEKKKAEIRSERQRLINQLRQEGNSAFPLVTAQLGQALSGSKQPQPRGGAASSPIKAGRREKMISFIKDRIAKHKDSVRLPMTIEEYERRIVRADLTESEVVFLARVSAAIIQQARLSGQYADAKRDDKEVQELLEKESRNGNIRMEKIPDIKSTALWLHADLEHVALGEYISASDASEALLLIAEILKSSVEDFVLSGFSRLWVGDDGYKQKIETLITYLKAIKDKLVPYREFMGRFIQDIGDDGVSRGKKLSHINYFIENVAPQGKRRYSPAAMFKINHLLGEIIEVLVASSPAMNESADRIPQPYAEWFQSGTRIRVTWDNLGAWDTVEGVIVNITRAETDPSYAIWLKVEGEDDDVGIFVKHISKAEKIDNSADQAGSSPVRTVKGQSPSTPEIGRTGTVPTDVGGIDFRVMNIVTQPLVSSSSLNLRLPELANLAGFNLDEEFQQLQNMLAAGIVPSGERIKEFLAACQLKGEWNSRIQDIISCLIEICRLEEDNVSETPLEIKEALIIADSANVGG